MNLITVLIISFFIVAILGTLLHFTHSIFKRGFLLHAFSAVNESTWEHMKLLVAPTLLAILFQYIVLKNIYPNVINSGLVLLLVEVIAIPIIYEPLHSLFGKIPVLINILIFYIAILLGIYIQYLFLEKGYVILNEWISLSIIIGITILFGIFTYYPPKMPLFRDPVTKKYGDIK